MIPWIGLKSILKSLVLPPTGLLLLALVGLGLAARRPRLGRIIAFTAVAGLLVLSMPAVSELLVETLEPPRPFSAESAKGAKAIVILGGGSRQNAADYGADTLGRLTLERVRYGARVARMTGLPVLVSGGRPPHGEAEAMLMRQALEEEFGVRVQWMEAESINTHENAVRSARILQSAGISKVVLVTHGFDMRRASTEFRNAGIESVPAATNLSAPGPYTLSDWVPGIGGLQTSYYALYEILANLVRWLNLAAR